MDNLYNGFGKDLTNLNSSSLTSIKQSLNSSDQPTIKERYLVHSTRFIQCQSNHDPFSPEVMTAFEALSHEDGVNNVDIRPRVLDSNTGEHTLLDSGSQCTVIKPDPGDVPDPSISLESVSGHKLKCYGKKEIRIKIGRKEFPIMAVKAQVKETILGWDFVKRHRLGFEWSEFGDIYIFDKKSGISSPLKYTSIPHDSLPRISPSGEGAGGRIHSA